MAKRPRFRARGQGGPQSAGGGYVPSQRLAAFSEIPYTGIYTAQASTQIKVVSRMRHYVINDQSYLKFGFVGYYCQNTVAIEANHGSDQTVNCSVEIPTAPGTTLVRVKFSGVNAGTIVNGAAIYWSDNLLPSDFGFAGGVFPDDTIFWVKDEREVPTSGNVIKGRGTSSPTITGEGCYFGATSATTQVDNTGVLVNTGGWTSRAEKFNPAIIVGERPVQPQMAVGLIGDSIIAFQDDNQGDGVNGSGGFAARALASVSGHKVAYIKLCSPGERLLNFIAGSKRQQLFPYFTHAITEYGTNDLNFSRTPTQIRADLHTLWNSLRAGGVQHIEQTLIIPRTTGAWTAVDGSDQSYSTGFGPAGNRDTVNTNIIADVGTGTDTVDNYIDVHTGIITNASDDHKWFAPLYTQDGVHPRPTPHGLMAAPVATRAATWTVT